MHVLLSPVAHRWVLQQGRTQLLCDRQILLQVHCLRPSPEAVHTAKVISKIFTDRTVQKRAFWLLSSRLLHLSLDVFKCAEPSKRLLVDSLTLHQVIIDPHTCHCLLNLILDNLFLFLELLLVDSLVQHVSHGSLHTQQYASL